MKKLLTVLLLTTLFLTACGGEGGSPDMLTPVSTAPEPSSGTQTTEPPTPEVTAPVTTPAPAPEVTAPAPETTSVPVTTAPPDGILSPDERLAHQVWINNLLTVGKLALPREAAVYEKSRHYTSYEDIMRDVTLSDNGLIVKVIFIGTNTQDGNLTMSMGVALEVFYAGANVSIGVGEPLWLCEKYYIDDNSVMRFADGVSMPLFDEGEYIIAGIFSPDDQYAFLDYSPECVYSCNLTFDEQLALYNGYGINIYSAFASPETVRPIYDMFYETYVKTEKE